ncbi:MAG: FHA domain-containing protein, partial [Phycisphaerae bacterium]|nr:FHA domain-containing protein [Phycisphaerae bacterium]
MDDRAVSRRHLRIFREGKEWVAEDLNSSQGTLINEAVVSKKKLSDGDEIRIGKCKIFFRRGRLKEESEGYALPAGLSLANAKPHRLDIL